MAARCERHTDKEGDTQTQTLTQTMAGIPREGEGEAEAEAEVGGVGVGVGVGVENVTASEKVTAVVRVLVGADGEWSRCMRERERCV